MERLRNIHVIIGREGQSCVMTYVTYDDMFLTMVVDLEEIRKIIRIKKNTYGAGVCIFVFHSHFITSKSASQ